MDQITTYHCSEHDDVPRVMRSLVGLVCVLSLLGSSVLILTYILNKENRTVARAILVHLSVSNIGQVVASLVGILADLNYRPQHLLIDTCRYQALATMYFNVSGMLWTVSLAMYLYLLVLGMTQYLRHILWFFSVACYLMPMVVAAWLFLTDRVGRAPGSLPGYCGLLDQFNYRFGEDGDDCYAVHDVFGSIFGYNLWVILTIVLTLLFYVMALCYLKVHKNEGRVASDHLLTAVFRVDYKLITIPVVFTLLRVWSVILSAYLLFQEKSVNSPLYLRLLTGIGNNAQGFVDALIFVALTDTIRRKIIRSLYCCTLKKKTQGNGSTKVIYRKNAYDSSLVKYGPKYSISSSPIDVEDIRISGSPEPTTSVKESPKFGSSYYHDNQF